MNIGVNAKRSSERTGNHAGQEDFLFSRVMNERITSGEVNRSDLLRDRRQSEKIGGPDFVGSVPCPIASRLLASNGHLNNLLARPKAIITNEKHFPKALEPLLSLDLAWPRIFKISVIFPLMFLNLMMP